jgi:hypothetical protein
MWSVMRRCNCRVYWMLKRAPPVACGLQLGCAALQRKLFLSERTDKKSLQGVLDYLRASA